MQDLSKEAKILPLVKDLFTHANEDVRLATSIMLGDLTIGSPQFFSEKVFGLVQLSDDRQKYLFINTIREIIIADSKCLQAYTSELLTLLMTNTEHPEESIRSIVAECLGRLSADFPSELLSALDDSLKTSNSCLTKGTIARSVRHSGSRTKDLMFLQLMTQNLIRLQSETDPDVKKNALDGLTTIIHANWVTLKHNLIQNLGDIENFAHQETSIRKELIEEVDLGPFK